MHSDKPPTPARTFSRRTLLKGGAAFGLGIAASAFIVDTAVARETSGPDIELAASGVTDYRIYLGAGEDAVVQQAAEELSAYLEQITGAVFAVVAASAPPTGGKLLVVGVNNPVAASFASTIDYASLGDDGFALRTDSSTVLVAGAGSRGVLYGAYWVLDRLLGVRWFDDGDPRVPDSPTVTVQASLLNADHVPRFRHRSILAGDANDPAYRQHNMLNGLRDQYWDVPTPPGIDTWDHYWPEEVHGQFKEVVTDEAFWHGGQLLCMDEGTRAAAAASLVTIINARIADGQDASTAFYQNDNEWTPDAASQAFADAHGGTLAAPVVDMLNDVVARVRLQIPNARLETQAYMWSMEPPTGLLLDDNVVLTIAPYPNFAFSLFAPENQTIRDQITAWSAIANNIVLWDYFTVFSSYIQPFPNYWAIAESAVALAAIPEAQGYFAEGAYTSPGAEFTDLRIWVLSRLLWDPSLDIDDLIRAFCQGQFGAAGDHVYDYLQLMATAAQASPVSMGVWDPVTAPYFDFDTMRQADALLAQAQAQAAVAGSPLEQLHVATARLGADYVILMRSLEYVETAAAESISWNPDTAARLVRFDNALDASGLTSNGADPFPPAKLKTLVRIASTPAAPPAAVAGMAADDWIDFQEGTLRLSAFTSFEPDSAASNDYTILTQGWGLQLPLDRLPADRTWDLYFSARVVATGVAPASTAISGLMIPAPGGLMSVSVSDVADGEYHEFRLPGSYERDATAYAVVAAADDPNIHVYVDRMFAIARVPATTAVPPAAAAGLAAGDWVDFQEDVLRLSAMTVIQPDAAASNGQAVLTRGWGVQLPFDQLPATGSWKLYVSARAVVGSAPSSTVALGALVIPTPGALLDITVGELADGGYHEILIPGTHQRDASKYAVISAAEVPGVHVIVDRVFAVRV